MKPKFFNIKIEAFHLSTKFVTSLILTIAALLQPCTLEIREKWAGHRLFICTYYLRSRCNTLFGQIFENKVTQNRSKEKYHYRNRIQKKCSFKKISLSKYKKEVEIVFIHLVITIGQFKAMRLETACPSKKKKSTSA